MTPQDRISRCEEKSNLFEMRVPFRYMHVEPAEKLPESECTVLYGGYGTGKTWAAYSIARKMFIEAEISDFEIVTQAGLLREIKAGFTDNSFDERVNKFLKTGLLVVDEMGKNDDTDFNKAQLFDIINNRYDWMRPTILICNCDDKDKIPGILGLAIADRFRGNTIKMSGTSKR